MNERILAYLRGQSGYVSGGTMCEALGISRTAVWKHINQLREMGYEISSRSNCGYRLETAPDTPTALEVTPLLTTEFLGCEVRYEPDVASTNRIASRLAAEGAAEGTVVVADSQTSGRGRCERAWFSPAGANLYMSVVLRPAVPPYLIPQMSLVTGVALTRTLRGRYPTLDVRIKWPNDLLTPSGKLAGILCDMDAEMDRVHHLVLGVGLNVNLAREEFPEELSGIATSLQAETGQTTPRAALLASFLNELEPAYLLWQQDGLASIQEDWQRWSLLEGREVTVSTGRGQLTGTVEGLSASGALCLRLEDSSLTEVHSGDVHVESF